MSRILINGMSAKSAGGKSILRNFLGALSRDAGGHNYLVVVPKEAGYEEFEANSIHIQEVVGTSGPAGLFRISHRQLPRLLVEERCDLLLNLSDIPIPTERPQVFLFDWPYAAYPESPAWRMGSWRDRIIRHVKLWLFRRNLHHVNVLVAQSEFMASRISKIYGIDNIAVVPNAVSLENLHGGVDRDFKLGSGFKLLCLSAYYSHKNLEVLLPVARKIKQAGMDVKIVTTLESSQHSHAAAFLKSVTEEQLEDVICNIGAVPMINVPSLFKQSNALILPTLLESFSGTYVEAMFHGRPILTSNLGFAEAVCGDAAIYFNPTDPEDIFCAIMRIKESAATYQALVKAGEQRLALMQDWPTATASLIGLCERTLLEAVQGPPGIIYD